MADLIAGPDYPLNPLEVFALGGAILLHDLGLGLAAWPDGLAGIKTGLGWQDALINHLRKHLGLKRENLCAALALHSRRMTSRGCTAASA